MPLRFLIAVAMPFCASALSFAETPAGRSTDFSREVRPILSDHCFACHGPDEHHREADLRLDTAAGIAGVIEPGEVDASELAQRLRSDDADVVMPPPGFNKPLTEKQKRTLEAWIVEGGVSRGHWSFSRPVKADLPKGVSHPIDHFIDLKIAAKELIANPIANDTSLLRRVCLDLTGLPPTRDQIQLCDDGKLDYERLVDELLASPAFGQHFGRYWLDLVRYADTHGLHLDNYREMWPYRDWVIDAVRDNMPFDQFMIEQLAGDLLPDATKSQRIATGFNRLNVTTNEGGSIYDEVFARNVMDRTDAFGTVFLGMTTQCAVCHDHKFDPISQKEYYSLSAFFNSLDGRALDGNKKDHAPVIRVPSREQDVQLADLARQIRELRVEMAEPIESVDAAQIVWEESLIAEDEVDAVETGDRREVLIPADALSSGGAELTISDDGTVRLGGKITAKDSQTLVLSLPESPGGGNWRTIELEVLADPKTDRAGVSPNGNAVLTEISIATRSSESRSDADWKPLPVESALADIEQDKTSFAVAFAIDGLRDDAKGWAIAGQDQKGGRKAWFSVPDLMERINDGAGQIQIRLDYLSRFAKHQFYAVRVSLSEAKAQLPTKDLIAVGDLHAVGPFPVESESPGFYRSFASDQAAFKSGETFKYEDKTFRWEKRDDWTPVGIHQLPVPGDAVAVNLIHQSLDSPKKQSIDLLLGTSDGHVVFLNKKRVAESRETGPIRPLAKTYKLELKKGHNDLYIRMVSQVRPAQFAYAYRSPAIELPHAIVELVGENRELRTPEQAASLRAYYRQVQCTHPDWQVLDDLVGGAEAEREKLLGEVPTTLIWKELGEPREAKLLIRGQYDQPGEAVLRSVPAFLPPMSDDLSGDRLGLAKWLASKDHPLTARVAVNRFWQSIFGIGLVKSSEDFGSQGEPPSHAELLDWLAVDFVENGWDVKRLIKQMVTSDAYRRDAAITEESFAADPDNRFLARGPRHRLDAEVLRDQALALAGLLNLESSGPSVKPPQPDGLWFAVGYTRSNTANFKEDSEPTKQLRRSVYIFWKRTSAPPQMSTFDAPSRESCTARRERTNTPLQALLLMNEHQYLQAAKHFAARALRESGLDDPSDKLAWLFETATARKPLESETHEMHSLLQKLLAHYRENSDAAAQLLSVDDMNLDAIEPAEHAAWMMIASTLLNLDEVVNK